MRKVSPENDAVPASSPWDGELGGERGGEQIGYPCRYDMAAAELVPISIK